MIIDILLGDIGMSRVITICHLHENQRFPVHTIAQKIQHGTRTHFGFGLIGRFRCLHSRM